MKLRAVLGYSGGKSRVISTILPYFPKQFDKNKSTYYEPFSGACTTLLTLQPRKAVINDINPWIVLVYYLIKVAPERFLNCLDTLQGTDKQKEAKYKSVIDLFNVHKRKLQKLIPHSLNSISPDLLRKLILPTCQFYFIIKLSYGGRFQIEPNGDLKAATNTSKIIGRHLYNEDLIMNIHKYLSDQHNDIKFFHGDYTKVLGTVKPGDFVYTDPPYWDSKFENNIAKYDVNLFDEKCQVKLRDKCIELSQKGCFVLQSNSWYKELNKLYKGFKIVKIQVRRTLYIRKDEAEDVCNEVLIMNYN
jgi:DNA adenine methylase